MSNWNKCETCKYFYDIYYVGEFCEECAAGVCYLCAYMREKCNEYEEGEVPNNKKRGKHI